VISVSVKTPLPATNTSVTGSRKREFVQSERLARRRGEAEKGSPSSFLVRQLQPRTRGESSSHRQTENREEDRTRRQDATPLHIYFKAPFSLKNFSGAGCRLLDASGSSGRWPSAA